ncbi:DUF2124 family protein [Methanocella sp. MCL-LM]|uniref:DUF2124 family protein n=1 Tax=Methanocella sp. MCL-LM TaxID=3412035 RepID=UPI003C734AF5
MNKNTIETSKGLSGMLRMFKTTMVDKLGLQPTHRIAFVGCAGTCVPFIELFAYTIRETMPGMTLIPDGIVDDARSIWFVKDIGMQIGGNADPRGADYVVLLGGISMPSSKLSMEATNKLIKEVMKPGGKVVGVCFMDMFSKAGWEGKVPFDMVMNANIDSVTLDKVE